MSTYLGYSKFNCLRLITKEVHTDTKIKVAHVHLHNNGKGVHLKEYYKLVKTTLKQFE